MTLFPVFLLTCAAAGAAGVFFRPGAWYRHLDKPDWTPPNWMFPVIWAVLYILIALAAKRLFFIRTSSFIPSRKFYFRIPLALWRITDL